MYTITKIKVFAFLRTISLWASSNWRVFAATWDKLGCCPHKMNGVICSIKNSVQCNSQFCWSHGNTEGVVGNNKMLQLWRYCFKRCELMRSRYKECLRCTCIATTYKTLQPSRLWILRYLGPRSSNYIYSPGFHQMWFDYQSWLCVKSRADYTSRCDLIECSDEFLIVVAPD